VLVPLEQRQDIAIAPPGIAEVRPGVEIRAISAREDHPVEAARPAENLPARMRDPAAAEVRLRGSRVAPVVRAAERLRRSRRVGGGGVWWPGWPGLRGGSTDGGGWWIGGLSSGPPASISTPSPPASASRRASTHPADPAPITITSALSGTSASVAVIRALFSS